MRASSELENPSEKANPAIKITLITVAGTVIAALLTATATLGGAKIQAGATKPSKSATPVPTGSTNHQNAYFAGGRHRRQSIPVSFGKYAKMNPCISIDSNNQVIIWGDYTAEVTGTFTVFVWLIDTANQDPVAGTLVRCPVTFTHVGQQQAEPCKKSGITPPRSGKWEASMVVEPGTLQTPNLWNTNYKGTQSGNVTWNG